MLSNSKTQKIYIDSKAKERGFANVEVSPRSPFPPSQARLRSRRCHTPPSRLLTTADHSRPSCVR